MIALKTNPKIGLDNFINFLLPFVLFIPFVIQSQQLIIASTILLVAFTFFLNLVINRALFTFLVLCFLVASLSFDKKISYLFYFFQTLLIFFLAYSLKPNESLFQGTKALLMLFIFFIMMGIYQYYELTEPLSYLIPGSSTNGIPSYLIILVCFYLSLKKLLKKKYSFVDHLIIFITIYISIVGIGRGSILISLMLSFIYFSYIYFQSSGPVKVLILSIAVGLFLANLNLFQILYEYIVSSSKLSVGLIDINRLDILNSYLGELNFISVFTGQNFSSTIINTEFNGNPHISLIRAHNLFGIFYILFIMLSPLYVLFFNSNKMLIFFFVSLMFLRSLTEPILFPTSLDFFYFFIIFNAWR